MSLANQTFHLGTDPSVLDLHDRNVLAVNPRFKGPSWDSMLQGLAAQDLTLGHRLRLVVDFINKNDVVTLNYDERNLTERDFYVGVSEFLNEHPSRSNDELTEGLVRDGGDEILQAQMAALLPMENGAYDENLGHTSGMFKATVLNTSAQQADGEFEVEASDIESLLNRLEKKQSKFQKTFEGGNSDPEQLAWTIAAEAGEGTDLALLLTFLHEAGHQVFAQAERKFPNDVSGYVPTQQNNSRYGLSSSGESYAEGFVWFVLDPAGMKETAPEYFQWVQTCWTLANK
ncbi:hypothetical protein IQ273_18865 [Nodosilinea sp. LEGE 07298]|uniref:hypothetical protein n=1 Tax=Nodosilinea sp. LEGE 07298 TaxID=2777970 RepID=UPI00188240F4|nr:hypothetical protein [Nodosilinea sp. LEGE 07298]MBE9111469.1 hypothetical protein [Nodosilinea sp. LEGE 07298]